MLKTKQWFLLPDPQHNIPATRVRFERLRKKSNVRERPKYQLKNRREKNIDVAKAGLSSVLSERKRTIL